MEVETSTTNEGSLLSAPLFVGAEALAISPRRSYCLQQVANKTMSLPTPFTSSTPVPATTGKTQKAKPVTPPEPSTSARPQRSTWKGPPLPAETGCPETGAKFMA